MNRLEFKQAPGDDEGQAAVHGVTESQRINIMNTLQSLLSCEKYFTTI